MSCSPQQLVSCRDPIRTEMKTRRADVKETPVMLSLMIALACTETHTHTHARRVWIACMPHRFLQLSNELV